MDVVNVGVVVTLRISGFGWFVGGVGFGLWGLVFWFCLSILRLVLWLNLVDLVCFEFFSW